MSCHFERSRELMEMFYTEIRRVFFEFDCVDKRYTERFTYLIKELSLRAKSRTNGNVLHRDSLSFFILIVLNRDTQSVSLI
jgi:hypothetical protein